MDPTPLGSHGVNLSATTPTSLPASRTLAPDRPRTAPRRRGVRTSVGLGSHAPRQVEEQPNRGERADPAEVAGDRRNRGSLRGLRRSPTCLVSLCSRRGDRRLGCNSNRTTGPRGPPLSNSQRATRIVVWFTAARSQRHRSVPHSVPSADDVTAVVLAIRESGPSSPRRSAVEDRLAEEAGALVEGPLRALGEPSRRGGQPSDADPSRRLSSRFACRISSMSDCRGRAPCPPTRGPARGDRWRESPDRRRSSR